MFLISFYREKAFKDFEKHYGALLKKVRNIAVFGDLVKLNCILF